MQHILFISYDGMTDPLGQSQVIPYLQGLTKYGYRFSILSCDKPDKYASHKAHIENILSGYPIQWISIPYHKNPPVLSSLYDFRQIKKSIRRLQQTDPVDMVHTRPGLPALAGIWMKKKYGTKFMNDIRGFWADERVDGGMWNLSNPVFKFIYAYFRKQEDLAIRLADYNTCLTKNAEKEIRSWNRVPQPVRLSVIPCSVDMNFFNPANYSREHRDAVRKSIGVSDNDLLVSYLGSIGGWYLTREMMQCCRYIADAHPSARFLFISNNRHEDIKKEADAAGIASDRLIIRQAPHHEVPMWLSLSDYSIFFIKPCYSKISSSPTKQAEIMAMGIPIISNSGVGDVEEIIRAHEAGLVASTLDEKSLREIAKQAVAQLGQFNQEKIRKGAIAVFDLKQAVEAYALIYDAVLGKIPKNFANYC